MRRTLTWSLALGALALGGLHVALTFFSFNVLSADALWFAGSGAAVIVGGLANVMALRSYAEDGLARVALLIINAGLAGLFALAAFVLGDMAPYVGLVLFGALTLLASAPPRHGG